MEVKCKICFSEMHPKRFAIGYRTCISCSDEQKWSGVPVINHKTGNEIQIVKDPEVAADFMAKSARTGFGTLKGMSSSYKKPVSNQPQVNKILPDKPLVDREIGRKQLPHEFEAVGKEIMALIESGNVADAHKAIANAVAEKRIYKNHATQLTSIIEVLTQC